MRPTIEILDSSFNVVTQLRSLYPIDKNGNVLQYSKELSDFGQAKFRLDAQDPIFKNFGDILVPHQYHLRIRRGTSTVWQGAIIENSVRNKDYVEVIAAEYLFYLSKKLIHRTSPDANGTANIYRTFSTGSMGDAVTALVNETITDYAAYPNHPMNLLTIGSITNPNYPANFTDTGGNQLTGAWAFSDNLTLQYDFHTMLYVLKAFGVLSQSDCQIIPNAAGTGLILNFAPFIGNDRHYSVTFRYGLQGNVVDFQLPRFGQRQVNSIIGIATDPNGIILSNNQTDQASIAKYGLLEGVAAFSDVKSQNILNARLQAELPLVSTPDETNVNVVLNEKAYPLGVYDIGDIVQIQIDTQALGFNISAIDFNEPRRVVGITVRQHSTGREITTVQSNTPLPGQLGGANS